MSRLISSPDLWNLHCAAGRQDEVHAWLRANGLDPLNVLNDHGVYIDNTTDGPVIRCHVIELDGDRPQERSVPLVLAPPGHWPTGEIPGEFVGHDDGPSVAECADNDRRWDLEREGE